MELDFNGQDDRTTRPIIRFTESARKVNRSVRTERLRTRLGDKSKPRWCMDAVETIVISGRVFQMTGMSRQRYANRSSGNR